MCLLLITLLVLIPKQKHTANTKGVLSNFIMNSSLLQPKQLNHNTMYIEKSQHQSVHSPDICQTSLFRIVAPLLNVTLLPPSVLPAHPPLLPWQHPSPPAWPVDALPQWWSLGAAGKILPDLQERWRDIRSKLWFDMEVFDHRARLFEGISANSTCWCCGWKLKHVWMPKTHLEVWPLAWWGAHHSRSSIWFCRSWSWRVSRCGCLGAGRRCPAARYIYYLSLFCCKQPLYDRRAC